MHSARTRIAHLTAVAALTLGLAALSFSTLVPVEPAAAQPFECAGRAGTPYKSGALTASAITTIYCSRAVDKIEVRGVLTRGSTRTERTSTCYNTSNCSVRVDLQLLVGWYESSVSGYALVPGYTQAVQKCCGGAYLYP